MTCLQDGRELQNRLYRAGFVILQYVPLTADHAPSRTLYTWRVDIDAAADKLAAEMYKAALNVCLRLDHEYKQQKDVSMPYSACVLQLHFSSISQSGMFVCVCHWNELTKDAYLTCMSEKIHALHKTLHHNTCPCQVAVCLCDNAASLSD